MPKILKVVFQHKIIGLIIVVVLAASGYFGYKKLSPANNETRYVLAAVEKGTIISSVSGSGQVSATNQVDIKSKVSGDAIYVGAKAGDTAKAGAILVQINNSDAQKTIRDAETNLETAKLSLEKLNQPPDQLSVLQAENALIQAQNTKQKAQDDLQKAYDDGFNAVANAFLDLPNVITGLRDVVLGATLNTSQWNIDYYADAIRRYDSQVVQYRNDAYNAYKTAQAAYDKNFSDYKSTSRFSDKNVIEALINGTYDTTKAIAEAVKSANNLIQFYQNELTKRNFKPQPFSDTHLSSLNNYTGKTNSQLSSLLAAKTTIKNDKDAIVSADRSIVEKTESMAKLKAGPDALDVRSQELSIQQKENALADAKAKLADYTIRAPFDGVAVTVNVKKGDAVSNSTALVTMITHQSLAEVSLNEVDAAKVKVGQKATLTFDAVTDLNLTGEVLEVDSIGTVTQGVVNYKVKIGFDTQDARIKPGMSVSAAIIVEAKQNVLLVPNAALKSQGNNSYVEILSEINSQNNLSASIGNSAGIISKTSPRQQAVATGLSDDSNTEITSGLQEGDLIITKTITTTASSATQTQSSQNRSIFQSLGDSRSGGAVRVPD